MFNYRINDVGLTVCSCEENQSKMAVRKSSAPQANIYFRLLRVITLVFKLTCAASSWLMNMAPTCLIPSHLIKLFHIYASGTEMNFILKFPCYISRDKYLWHTGFIVMPGICSLFILERLWLIRVASKHHDITWHARRYGCSYDMICRASHRQGLNRLCCFKTSTTVNISSG